MNGPCQRIKKKTLRNIRVIMIPIILVQLEWSLKAWKNTNGFGNQEKDLDHPDLEIFVATKTSVKDHESKLV